MNAEPAPAGAAGPFRGAEEVLKFPDAGRPSPSPGGEDPVDLRDAGAGLLVLTALGLEARAVRRMLPAATVVDVGMGPQRAARGAREALETGRAAGITAVAVAGFCGALDPALKPGSVVVASDVRRAGPSGASGPEVRKCPSSPLLVAGLQAMGLDATAGPLLSLDHVAGRAERAGLRSTGAVAVDMESAWILDALHDSPPSPSQVDAGGPPSGSGNGQPQPDLPVAVLRVVVDDHEHGLVSARTPGRSLRAWHELRRAAPVLAEWAAATRVPSGRRVALLAGPRSFCAGVERAIEIVEASLERFGAPVYVRKQIVHNRHVVADLEARGAIFVDEPAEVPEGAHVVFSAHGVSPAVRQSAADRKLQVIDATCPLVSKVHAEARRFAAEGATILLIGHAGHEEVEGTTGEAPEATVLVERAEDVAALDVAEAGPVAYLTQTTLALDETAGIVDRLRERFPALQSPPTEDICYATQNRQDALAAIAQDCDVVFVVGSANSSNSKRLVELAERLGTEAHLIDDETDLRLAWLAGRERIAITAGASAPEALVERVLATLAGLGPIDISERSVTLESIHFAVPKEVR